MNDQPTLFTQAPAHVIEKAPHKRKPRTAPTQTEPAPTAEPIPKRLYCCDGLIFGLVDGGQPDDSYHPPITWEPFKPVSRVSNDAQREARTK